MRDLWDKLATAMPKENDDGLYYEKNNKKNGYPCFVCVKNGHVHSNPGGPCVFHMDVKLWENCIYANKTAATGATQYYYNAYVFDLRICISLTEDDVMQTVVRGLKHKEINLKIE